MPSQISRRQRGGGHSPASQAARRPMGRRFSASPRNFGRRRRRGRRRCRGRRQGRPWPSRRQRSRNNGGGVMGGMLRRRGAAALPPPQGLSVAKVFLDPTGRHTLATLQDTYHRPVEASERARRPVSPSARPSLPVFSRPAYPVPTSSTCPPTIPRGLPFAPPRPFSACQGLVLPHPVGPRLPPPEAARPTGHLRRMAPGPGRGGGFPGVPAGNRERDAVRARDGLQGEEGEGGAAGAAGGKRRRGPEEGGDIRGRGRGIGWPPPSPPPPER